MAVESDTTQEKSDYNKLLKQKINGKFKYKLDVVYLELFHIFSHYSCLLQLYCYRTIGKIFYNGRKKIDTN